MDNVTAGVKKERRTFYGLAAVEVERLIEFIHSLPPGTEVEKVKAIRDESNLGLKESRNLWFAYQKAMELTAK